MEIDASSTSEGRRDDKFTSHLNRTTSYLQLLRQGRAELEEQQADPMWQATLQTVRHDRLDHPLREMVAKLLTHTLSSGRDRLSGREIFWRLRVPPRLEQCEGRNLARVLRSLGWVRVR